MHFRLSAATYVWWLSVVWLLYQLNFCLAEAHLYLETHRETSSSISSEQQYVLIMYGCISIKSSKSKLNRVLSCPEITLLSAELQIYYE